VAAADRRQAGEAAEELVAGAVEVDGVKLVAARVDGLDAKALIALADRVRDKLGEAAVVLGGEASGKAVLAASFTKSVVERGPKAGDVIREGATAMGGGGGGRDDAAQAGGGDPEKLDEALATARAAIEAALA
jgi:alanyl-tRNA synthetase